VFEAQEMHSVTAVIVMVHIWKSLPDAQYSSQQYSCGFNPNPDNSNTGVEDPVWHDWALVCVLAAPRFLLSIGWYLDKYSSIASRGACTSGSARAAVPLPSSKFDL